MRKHIIIFAVFLSLQYISFSQTIASSAPYPQIRGYASIIHPIVIIDNNGSTFNFNGSYTVGFPFGINLLKSDKIGFSFELTPTIKAENGTDRVSSLLFHPGVMFRFHQGFTFIQRLAFETNGRYGLTPVFNKVIINKPNVKYFVAVPVPIRFGNNAPISLGAGLQLGINF